MERIDRSNVTAKLFRNDPDGHLDVGHLKDLKVLIVRTVAQ